MALQAAADVNLTNRMYTSIVIFLMTTKQFLHI